MKWFWHQASAGLNTTPGLKNHRKNLSLLGCAFYFLGNWLRDKVWKCKKINDDNKFNYILLLLLVLLLLIVTIIITIVITILITIVITIISAYYYFYYYYCYYYYYYLLLLLLLSLSLLSLSLLLSLLLLSLSLLLLLYTIIIISIYLYCDSYYYYSYDYHHCYHYYCHDYHHIYLYLCMSMYVPTIIFSRSGPCLVTKYLGTSSHCVAAPRSFFATAAAEACAWPGRKSWT